eukprot:537421_1
MGNSVVGTKLHKRKLSAIHSGHTYIPSQAFDESVSDVQKHLPQSLKKYSNSVEVLYRFWRSEIDTMTEDTYKETAVLFYMNVFDKIPDSKKLFKKNIELQAKQFFGMFRWLITNLKNADATRLIKRIKTLGNIHKQMNVKNKWYGLLLQAFHDTMTEATKGNYTPRIRFCMEQLYTVVANIMLGNDFDSLNSNKISYLLQSLNNVEDCLNDKEGRLYLQMYMKKQFCVELM